MELTIDTTHQSYSVFAPVVLSILDARNDVVQGSDWRDVRAHLVAAPSLVEPETTGERK